jgi:hypothetical protein
VTDLYEPLAMRAQVHWKAHEPSTTQGKIQQELKIEQCAHNSFEYSKKEGTDNESKCKNESNHACFAD